MGQQATTAKPQSTLAEYEKEAIVAFFDMFLANETVLSYLAASLRSLNIPVAALRELLHNISSQSSIQIFCSPQVVWMSSMRIGCSVRLKRRGATKRGLVRRLANGVGWLRLQWDIDAKWGKG